MSDEQQVDESQTNTEEKSAESVLYDKEAKEASESKEQVKEEQSETQAEEAKEGADEAQEAKESKEFDLQLPEDSLLSDEAKAEMLDMAKEYGLDKDAAQKFLDIQGELISEYRDQIETEFSDQIKTWGEEIKADKELGGDNLDNSVRLVKKAVTAFAGEDFLQELDETGYGNHPKLFKMLANIGKELEAKSLVIGDKMADAPKSMAEAFYGKPASNN